eukprot:GHVU01113123.1.p5 GENE.GHVU01113123.1~~GHVU01113123.1.p5  ORF type:complete len:116 (-),score=7.02 GHVU01113123.1:289-636(-)
MHRATELPTHRATKPPTHRPPTHRPPPTHAPSHRPTKPPTHRATKPPTPTDPCTEPPTHRAGHRRVARGARVGAEDAEQGEQLQHERLRGPVGSLPVDRPQTALHLVMEGEREFV